MQSDGTLVCVPNASNWQTVYTDQACVDAIEVTRSFRQAACGLPVAPMYSRSYTETSACKNDFHVRSLYAPPNVALYRVLDEVPHGDLASPMLVTE